MSKVRIKSIGFMKSVLSIIVIAVIVLDTTTNAHTLRRRREIIDSDGSHVNGGSGRSTPTTSATTIPPTSNHTIVDDVSVDAVHLLELNHKTNSSDANERVGVATDISNTTSSSTHSKYSSLHDITPTNLNGSATLPPPSLTTSLPSSTTDVNNAIATDAFHEPHIDHKYDKDDGTKQKQRTTSMTTSSTIAAAETTSTSSAPMTAATAATSTTKANRAVHLTQDEPKSMHDTHEIVTDKRAKFLVDTSADFTATTSPSWANLKNVGEVNHNNVTFGKTADADVTVVKLDAKATANQGVPTTNGVNEPTESMRHAGGIAAESHKQKFDLNLNHNSSEIDDVHQDISVSALPTTTSTTTMSPATTTSSTTPKMSMSHTTTRASTHAFTTIPPQMTEEIELRLLPTTNDDTLITTTEDRPPETTLIDDSVATINTLKPNETEKKLLPIVDESTKIVESLPETTPSFTTFKSEAPIDQTTLNGVTELASEPITDAITTIMTSPSIPKTFPTQPHRLPLKPTTEVGLHAESTGPRVNHVEKQSENSISAETTSRSEMPTKPVTSSSKATSADTTIRTHEPEIVPTTTTMATTTTLLPTTTSTTSTSTTSTTTMATTTTTLMSTTTETMPTDETPGVDEGLNPEATDVNAMIAIIISIVSVITLILLAGFLIVMRKRQKQLSYAQRCRPLGLDDAYSLDNISVYNSVRRKNAMRTSKRAYGNAAFDDPALKNNLLTITQLAAFVQRRTSIYEEFRDVPLVTARIDEVPAGCEDKNRYANVVPLPESRVHLQRTDDDETTEYINANYVKGPKDTTHYYIACQAPMENTILDFWRMIWEQNSRVIIMATDLTENGIEKCAEYLPPSFVIDNHVTFGDFTITLKNREVRDKYAVSSMHLKNVQTKTWREITHLWYQWPETGTPSDETSVIAMLLEARSYLKMAAPEQCVATATDDDKLKSDDLEMKIANGNSDKSKSLQRVQGPLTVHCSPGTGRTGTIIACDIAIRTLEQPTRSVDIPQIVYCVRRGRASAVQTREQYEFIYKVTQMYATKLTGVNNEN